MNRDQIDDRRLAAEDPADPAAGPADPALCPECQGTGAMPSGETCPVCEGSGRATHRTGGG